MRILARPQAHSRGTADGGGAVMAVIQRALVCDVLLQQRHILERVDMLILVIGQEKDDIGLRLVDDGDLLNSRGHGEQAE